GALYPRTDRPAVLASFAPEVARCATEGDRVASRLLRHAAAHIAEAAAAACPAAGDERAGEVEVALTGGLFRLGEPLLVPLEEELTAQLPHARRVAAAGDPLSGAVTLAGALATGTLRLPEDPHLLYVPDH
ncbi:ATPase, partial [Streptomyces sp. NPDC048629]